MQIAPISNLQDHRHDCSWGLFKAVGLAEARAVPRMKEILKSFPSFVNVNGRETPALLTLF